LTAVPKKVTIVTEMVTAQEPAVVLFGRVRRAILALFFTRPDESFYLREIVRRTGFGVGPVQREVRQLLDCGILVRDRDRFFRVNAASPIFEPLKQIVVRTMGVGDVLRGRLSAISDRIVVAFVFGSFARGEQGEGSDVDVLVVSKDRKLGLVEATDLLSGAQERLGREVNPFVLNAAEFRRKMREGNHFIRRVVAGEKVFLIGGGDELERLAEERVVEAAQQQRGRNRRLARAGRS